MNIRKTIFWTHLIVGVGTGLIILFLSVTGMILAYKPQIVAANPDLKPWMKQVEGLHRWFGFKDPSIKPIAQNVKTVATFLFLGMVISGIYLWVPTKRMKFDPKARGKLKDWTGHNVVGFWCAPILLITTVTGLLMVYLPHGKPPQGNKVDVVKQERPIETPERKRWKLVKSIHTGEIGGIPGETIAFAASGGAIILVWTGLSLAWRRFSARTSNIKKERYV